MNPSLSEFPRSTPTLEEPAEALRLVAAAGSHGVQEVLAALSESNQGARP